MSHAFSADGTEFIYDTFTPETVQHTVVESINVDNGAVRIDHDDGDHLIYIAADIPSYKDYIKVENAAKTITHFRLQSDGTAEMKNLVVEDSIVNAEFAQVITDLDTTETTVVNLQSDFSTMLNSFSVQNDEFYQIQFDFTQLGYDLDEVKLDIEDRPTYLETDQTISDELIDVYAQIQSVEDEIQDATHEHTTQNNNSGKLIQHADELRLKEITCDKITVSEIETQGSIELLADSSLYFVPYQKQFNTQLLNLLMWITELFE